MHREARWLAQTHLGFSAPTQAVKPLRGKTQGPAQRVGVVQFSTTMALSTIRRLLAKQKLRRGDGAVSMPASRLRDRLFGNAGRTSNAVSWKIAGNEYDPKADSCIKAFVRLIAARRRRSSPWISPWTRTTTTLERLLLLDLCSIS